MDLQATEGDDFIDSTFNSHYTEATKAGFIRGGYHFCRPDVSSGTQQAEWFLAHGGGWSSDGRTLPGMLDLEANPYGSSHCYSKSASEMVAWISDFVNTYHSKTKVYPLIYTSISWWEECTGNSRAFSKTCPLSLASWNPSPGTIPGDWGFQTFWQNTDHYEYGGDSDIFNGDMAQLVKIAKG